MFYNKDSSRNRGGRENRGELSIGISSLYNVSSCFFLYDGFHQRAFSIRVPR